MTQPRNQRLLKSSNRMAVVRAIRAQPGVSRVTLAARLGLTKAAVGQIVEGLIADGWLTEQEPAFAARGRPARPIVLGGARFVFLGASLNGERTEALAMTLDGDVLEFTAHEKSDDLHEAIAGVANLLAAMYSRLVERGLSVQGVGVGVPGPVRAESGVLRYSDRRGWIEAPVRDLLTAALAERGIPPVQIVVERAVGCIALHQFDTERLADAGPLLYLHLGHSIAVSLANSDGLVHGFQGLAGTIAHMQVAPGGPRCECGRTGCANATLTLFALERELGMKASAMREAEAQGEPKVLAAVDAAGAMLAAFVRNMCLVYDPARVLAGGPAFQISTRLFSAMQRSLQEICDPINLPAPRLGVVRYDKDGVARGAAVALLHHIIQGRD